MFTDSRNQTEACNDVGGDGPSDTEVAAARVTVCDYVARKIPDEQRADVAEELMLILGIHPKGQRDYVGKASLPRTSVSSASIRGAHLS